VAITALAHGDKDTLAMLSQARAIQTENAATIIQLDAKYNLGIITAVPVSKPEVAVSFTRMFTVHNTLTEDVMRLLSDARIANAEGDKRVAAKVQESKLLEKTQEEKDNLEKLAMQAKDKGKKIKLLTLKVSLGKIREMLSTESGEARVKALKQLEAKQKEIGKILLEMLVGSTANA
jgi:hypothetical protein